MVGRGFLQFGVRMSASFLDFSARIHGKTIEDFIKSFANMLALVMLAWASYYSSKPNMNGYEWLLKNSQKRKNGFEKVHTTLDGFKQQKIPTRSSAM